MCGRAPSLLRRQRDQARLLDPAGSGHPKRRAQLERGADQLRLVVRYDTKAGERSLDVMLWGLVLLILKREGQLRCSGTDSSLTLRWREMDSNLQYRAVNEEVLTAIQGFAGAAVHPRTVDMIFTTTPRRALRAWCAEKHVCDPARVREWGRRLPRGGSGEPCWRARRSIPKTRGRGWIVIGGNNGLGVRLRRRMPRVALSGIALKAARRRRANGESRLLGLREHRQ